MNVLADTNRDGVVNDEDNISTKKYEVDYLKTPDALVLANTNFDGKLDGGKKRDCDDEQVNGDNDLKDVAMLKIHKLGLDANEIPEDMTVKLELLNPDNDTTGLTAAQKAHIFDGHQNNSTIMLGGTKPVAVIYKKNAGVGERNIADLAGTGNLELGIEGVEYGTEVIVRLTASLGAKKLLEDNQRILVSPFLVASNIGTVNRAFVETTKAPEGSTFADAFAALVGADITTKINGENYKDGDDYDPWVRDCMVIGYTRTASTSKSSYQEQNVVLDVARSRALGALPAQLSTPPYNFNYGYVKPVAVPLGDSESGGNISASPPNATYPAGRLVFCKEMDTDLKNFFIRQKVQTDSNNTIIEVPSDWLCLGHIDEIVSFCSIGGSNKILIAAPQEAMTIWNNTGGPWAKLAGAKIGDVFTAIGIAQDNISDDDWNMTIQDYNNAIWINYLADVEATLPAQVCIATTDVIRIPTVYLPSPDNGGAISKMYPNRVNLFVRGDGSFVVGDRTDTGQPVIVDPLRAVVAQRLGSNGKSISTNSFVLSAFLWSKSGDVHCGTNEARTGPTTKEWGQ